MPDAPKTEKVYYPRKLRKDSPASSLLAWVWLVLFLQPALGGLALTIYLEIASRSFNLGNYAYWGVVTASVYLPLHLFFGLPSLPRSLSARLDRKTSSMAIRITEDHVERTTPGYSEIMPINRIRKLVQLTDRAGTVRQIRLHGPGQKLFLLDFDDPESVIDEICTRGRASVHHEELGEEISSSAFHATGLVLCRSS